MAAALNRAIAASHLIIMSVTTKTGTGCRILALLYLKLSSGWTNQEECTAANNSAISSGGSDGSM